MRIVIDMQGAQTESRFRGIGRYTISFAQAVVRNSGEHEVFLVLSGFFPHTIEPIRKLFEALLPQENILVWHANGPVNEKLSNNNLRREIAESMREAFFASLNPDVVHLSSLFEGYVDDAVTSIARLDQLTPTSVMLYDLIPLQNPQCYLKPDPQYDSYYRQKIKYLRKASVYLTISEFSRQEGIEVLEESAERFVNISTAVDESFQPIFVDEDSACLLLGQLGVSRPFVLYVGGSDERKNLPRLIEAYAALPLALRKSHQLLFAGKMPDGDLLRFKKHCKNFGLNDDEVIFTGYVSDKVLVQLYSLCKLYVFPSWHEGFGLPALEAMACGASVIAANTSSLPEVIGLSEAMFDPMEASSIAEKICLALTDDVFRASLKQHGLVQAKKFSWDKTAQSAIEAWEALIRSPSNKSRSWKETRDDLCRIHDKLIANIGKVWSEGSGESDHMLRTVAYCIYQNELAAERQLRAKVLPEKITWRIEGPFDSSYSLALVNREIARALNSLGHDVLLHSTEGPGDFFPNENYLRVNPDLDMMYQRSKQREHVDCDVVSRNLYPPRVSDMSARFNFLHSFAWEESGFPMSWVDNFNDALQGMTVTSRHVQKVMIDHGVTVPIKVIWNGVDHWDQVSVDSEYVLQAQTYRFLHVSSCFPRKGVDVLLRAFGRAFRASDDVSLVIKTLPNEHNDIHQWLANIRANDSDYPDVKIIEDDFSDEKLKSLYLQCHTLVAPSRAEGFGLPMAEAMLSGLAVITTNWSGQTDFCNIDTAWMIDYEFQRAQSHFDLPSSVWAEPKEEHLAELMREVYVTSEPQRSQRIAAGQALLRQKFGWKDVAARMIAAARDCSQPKYLPSARIGWVTTWNTKCGIATYSEHLTNNMPANIFMLAANTEHCTVEDRKNVSRCWVAGEDDVLDNLESKIIENDINVIVIQFNYGFFNFEHFSNFIHRQVDGGRVVLVTLHATKDPAHVPHKKLIQLKSALTKCHRVLVHSHNDMNRLKDIGVTSNVTLFPHGIIDFVAPEKPKVGSGTIKLKSYGFFLPHKGLYELVEVVKILKTQGVKIQLEMVNAEYPAMASTAEIERVRARIREYGLENDVLLCTRFLLDEQSLERLSDADLIVFPYQETGESSSAAVRYGVASGRPVAVTPLQIFEDIFPAVHQLPGVDPGRMAEGILDIIKNDRKNDPDFLKKEQKALLWRNSNAYSRVGMRLHNMISTLSSEKSELH